MALHPTLLDNDTQTRIHNLASSEPAGTFYDQHGSESIPTCNGRYQEYFLAIYEAIRNVGANPVSAEEALTVIKVIELAIVSSQSGKRISL